MQENINKSIEVYKNNDYEKFSSYERFKFVKAHIESTCKEAGTFLDLGCAKGEFIYFLKKSHPHLKFTGLEYSEELIKIGSQQPELKDVDWIHGDAQGFSLSGLFDIVYMSGVLSIFDEIEPVLKNSLKHLSEKGTLYIWGAFTVDDIDVIIRYRDNKNSPGLWQSAWNMFSLKTIDKILHEEGAYCKAHKFSITTDLNRNHDSPVSSYTLNLEDGSRVIATGGNIIRDFYLLEIKKGEQN